MVILLSSVNLLCFQTMRESQQQCAQQCIINLIKFMVHKGKWYVLTLLHHILWKCLVRKKPQNQDNIGISWWLTFKKNKILHMRYHHHMGSLIFSWRICWILLQPTHSLSFFLKKMPSFFIWKFRYKVNHWKILNFYPQIEILTDLMVFRLILFVLATHTQKVF